jgi:hypothetical protein
MRERSNTQNRVRSAYVTVAHSTSTLTNTEKLAKWSISSSLRCDVAVLRQLASVSNQKPPLNSQSRQLTLPHRLVCSIVRLLEIFAHGRRRRGQFLTHRLFASFTLRSFVDRNDEQRIGLPYRDTVRCHLALKTILIAT